MIPDDRIDSFIRLGRWLKAFSSTPENVKYAELYYIVKKAAIANPWFTISNILMSFKALGEMLESEKVLRWMTPYRDRLDPSHQPRVVGLVMAGNIPAVGFHDLLCVLAAGDTVKVKLSSSDQLLIPSITRCLTELEPAWNNRIEYVTETLSGFDAVIATGNDNTARYFEYYFGKYPHIIRKNRNSIAVLTGNETSHQLKELAGDILHYFGLGCRSVSKLFLPKTFDKQRIINELIPFSNYLDHHKFANNHQYRKTILTMNNVPHTDAGPLLWVEDRTIASPIGVIHYEFYDDLSVLANRLEQEKDQIQCIVGESTLPFTTVSFGKAQSPELWDYADQIDTMDFLLSINE